MPISIEELSKVAAEKSVDVTPLLLQGFSPDEIYVALQYYQPSRGVIGELLSGLGAGTVGIAHSLGGVLQALPVTEDLGKVISEGTEKLLQSELLRPPTKAGLFSRIARTAGEFAPLLISTAVAPETLLGRVAIPVGFGAMGFGSAYASQPEEDKSIARALTTGAVHGGLAALPIGRVLDKELGKLAPTIAEKLPFIAKRIKPERITSALAEATTMPPIMSGMGAASVYGATGDIGQSLEQLKEIFSEQGLAEAIVGGLLGAIKPVRPSLPEREEQVTHAIPTLEFVRGVHPDYTKEIEGDITPQMGLMPPTEGLEIQPEPYRETARGIREEYKKEIGEEVRPPVVEMSYDDLIKDAVITEPSPQRKDILPEVSTEAPITPREPQDIYHEMSSYKARKDFLNSLREEIHAERGVGSTLGEFLNGLERSYELILMRRNKFPEEEVYRYEAELAITRRMKELWKKKDKDLDRRITDDDILALKDIAERAYDEVIDELKKALPPPTVKKAPREMVGTPVEELPPREEFESAFKYEDVLKYQHEAPKIKEIREALSEIKNSFTGLIESIRKGEQEGKYDVSSTLTTVAKLVKDMTTTTISDVNERVETLVDTVYGSAYSTISKALGIETPAVEAFVRGKKDIFSTEGVEITHEVAVPTFGTFIHPDDNLSIRLSKEFKTVWTELFNGDHRTATNIATTADNVIRSYLRNLTGEEVPVQEGAPKLLQEAFKLITPEGEEAPSAGEILLDPETASKIGDVLNALEREIIKKKKTLPRTTLSIEEALFLKLLTQYRDNLGSIVSADFKAKTDFADKVSRIIADIYMRNIHPLSALERLNAVETVDLLSPGSDFTAEINRRASELITKLSSVRSKLKTGKASLTKLIENGILAGKKEGLTVKEALNRVRRDIFKAQDVEEKQAVPQYLLQKQQGVIDKVLRDVEAKHKKASVKITDEVFSTIRKSLNEARNSILKDLDETIKQLKSFQKELKPDEKVKPSKIDLFVDYDPDTNTYKPTEIGRALGNIAPTLLVKQNTAWLKDIGTHLLRYKKTREVLDGLKEDADIKKLLKKLEKETGEKWTVDRLFTSVFEKLADRYNYVSDTFSRLYNLGLLNSLGIQLAEGKERTSTFQPNSVFDQITTTLAETIVKKDPSFEKTYKGKENAVQAIKKDISKILLAEMTRVTNAAKGTRGYDPIKAFVRGLGINITYVPSLKPFIKDLGVLKGKELKDFIVSNYFQSYEGQRLDYKKLAQSVFKKGKRQVDGYVVLSFDSFPILDAKLEKAIKAAKKYKSSTTRVKKIVEAVLDYENNGGEHIRDILESRYVEPIKDKVHIVVRESAFKDFLRNPSAENLKSKILAADTLLKELENEPVFKLQYEMRQTVLGKGGRKAERAPLAEVIEDILSKTYGTKKAAKEIADAIDEILRGRAIVSEDATTRQTIRFILGRLGMPLRLGSQTEQVSKEVQVLSKLLGRNFYFPTKEKKLPTSVENFLKDPREYYLFQVLHRLSLLAEEKAKEPSYAFTIQERHRGKGVRTSKDILQRSLYDEVVEEVADAYRRVKNGRIDLAVQGFLNRVAVFNKVVKQVLGEKIYIFMGLSEEDARILDEIIGSNAVGMAWRNTRIMAADMRGIKDDYKTLFHELFHIVADVITLKDPDYWNSIISKTLDTKRYEKALREKDYELADELLTDAEERLAVMFENYLADKTGIRETEDLSIIRKLFRLIEDIYVSIRNTLAAKGIIHTGIIDGRVVDREIIKFFETIWKGEYRNAEEAREAYWNIDEAFRFILGDEFVDAGDKVNELLDAEYVRVMSPKIFWDVHRLLKDYYGIVLNTTDPDSFYHRYLRKADDYIAEEIRAVAQASYRLGKEDVKRAWEGFKGAYEVFGKKEESPLFGKKKTVFDSLHTNFILPAFNKYLRPIYNLYKETVYKVNRLVHDEASACLNKTAWLKDKDPRLYEVFNRVVIEADKRERYPHNIKEIISEGLYESLTEGQRQDLKDAIESVTRLYNRQWFLQADKDLRHSLRLTTKSLEGALARHNIEPKLRQQMIDIITTRLQEVIRPYDTIASYGFNVFFENKNGKMIRKFREEEILKSIRKDLHTFLKKELPETLKELQLDESTINSLYASLNNFVTIYDTITDNALALADSFYIPRIRGGGDYELRIYEINKEIGEEGLGKLAVRESYYIDTSSEKTKMKQYKQIKDALRSILEEDLADQKVLVLSTQDYLKAKKQDPALTMSRYVTRELIRRGEDYDVVVVTGRKLLKEAQRNIEDFSPSELTTLIEKMAYTVQDPELQERMLTELPQMVLRAYADKSYGMSRRLRRVRIGADRDYAIQGYETDLYKILVSDLSKRTGYLINGFFTDAIADYRDTKFAELFRDPAMEEALNKYVQLLYAPHSAMASAVYKIRLFASLYFLGLRVASCVYNLTSFGTTFVPEAAGMLRSLVSSVKTDKPTPKEVLLLYKNAGKAIGDLKRYAKEGWISRDLSEIKIPEKAPQEDRIKLQVLRHLLDYNTLESSYVRMLREEVMNVLPEPLMKVSDVLMGPFRYSEIYSRAIGALGLVRAVMEHKNPTEVLAPEFLSKLREAVDRTFGDYTRANRMLLADPSTRFGAVMTLPTTLRGFVFNYFSLLAEWLGKRELEKIGFSLATFMLFGGLSGLPMLDDVIDAIEKYTGTSIRLRVKRALDKSVGETLSDFIIKGVPYMIGFSDWAPALRVETPFPLYPSARDLTEFMFGVYRGLYDKLAKGVDKISHEEYLSGLIAFMPYGLQLPVEAYKLATEGLRTRYGTPILDEKGQPVKLNVLETLIRALGFRPVDLAEIQDKRYLARRLLAQLSRQREKIYYKIRKDPTSRDILKMIDDYNKTALSYEGIVPLITGKTLKRVMTPKRQRELELWQAL